MKIIVGLGNPGLQYKNTRHNLGWKILDLLATQAGAKFNNQARFKAQTAQFELAEQKIILAKPTTFYNNSGEAARALLDFYKLDPAQDLLIIHDDLMLKFSKIRTRQTGNDGGNNGIKSLIAHFGKKFWRLKIGTDLAEKPKTNHDFVLDNFSKDEQKIIEQEIYPAVADLVHQFASQGLEADSIKVA